MAWAKNQPVTGKFINCILFILIILINYKKNVVKCNEPYSNPAIKRGVLFFPLDLICVLSYKIKNSFMFIPIIVKRCLRHQQISVKSSSASLHHRLSLP